MTNNQMDPLRAEIERLIAECEGPGLSPPNPQGETPHYRDGWVDGCCAVADRLRAALLRALRASVSGAPPPDGEAPSDDGKEGTR